MPRSLSKQEAMARYKEWRANVDAQDKAHKERLARIDRRARYLIELKGWLKRRKLEPHDLLLMYKEFAPRRAAKPVRTVKPLVPSHNVGRVNGHLRGQIMHDGKPVKRKGDP